MDVTQMIPGISKEPSEATGDGMRVRVELIFSEALEEDFDQIFKEEKIGKHFTKIANVMGAGYNNPHLGDSVWPQLNTMYIIYCGEDEARKIYDVVVRLRKKYLTEGIACFMSTASEL